MSRRSLLGIALALAAVVVMVGTISAQASKTVIYDSRDIFVATQPVDCIGVLNIEAIFRQRTTEWTDDSGGYHYSDHFNASQFRAVDAEEVEYSGSETFNHTVHVGSAGEFPSEVVFMDTLKAISHGAGPNLVLKFRRHLTINAPGQITASRELFSIECRPK
ncbi:MAG TPA: hypothetical protein VLN08_11645 [Vicinamibacterales bacterium]|nr:hypothetical protein [Vicinamibacterales bacterium]